MKKKNFVFLLVMICVMAFASITAFAEAKAYDMAIVKVNSGYLALRDEKATNPKNEIGKLYTGDRVYIVDDSDSTFWFVQTISLGSGFVNKNYLLLDSTYIVDVEKGYLALRDEKAFSTKNEIGKLYSGDKVTVLDMNDSTYWFVLTENGKAGFVNRNYLRSEAVYTVSVNTGYLALRNVMEYDTENEIGKLYSGDTVWVIEKTDLTYWWVYAPCLGKYGYVNSAYINN